MHDEIDPALIDHMEFYLLNYFKPGLGAQTTRTASGRARLDALRCTTCHVADLEIDSDRRVADVETVHDPQRGIFNRLFATASTRFVAIDDGQTHALVLPKGEPFVVRNIFTDFKRHDLGPNFHEREYDGTRRNEFLTEALWGVGSTAPYGHDGRSINLEEVILRHGGEAKESRDRFARLNDSEKREVLDFLATLVLFPPDDTASNLNPGEQVGRPAGPGRARLDQPRCAVPDPRRGAGVNSRARRGSATLGRHERQLRPARPLRRDLVRVLRRPQGGRRRDPA